MLTVFGIAVALAMDAFAVSLTTGVCSVKVTGGMTMRMASTFGGFQFLMPVIGWMLGVSARSYIESYDHWLAFALLALVGGHMLKEAWDSRGESAEACECRDYTSWKALVLLGVATSLDALAVGLSLAVLRVDVWIPSVIIGLVCFVLSAVGLHMGGFIRRLPKLGDLGGKANAFGGLVLIVIGFKILQEHGVF